MLQPIIKIIIISLLSIIVTPPNNMNAAETGKIPLKAFSQLKTTSSMQLSPDGNHVAYFEIYKGRKMIIVKPIGKKGKATAIPPGEGADISWFKWANNERLVLSFAFTGKRGLITTRETRLYGVNIDGSHMINIIKPRGKSKVGTRLGKGTIATQIQDDVIDWLPDEPDKIMVVVDSDQNAKDEIRIVNINNGKFKEINSGKRGVQNYQTDQQHKVRLAWGYDETRFVSMYLSPVSNKWISIEKTSWGEKGFYIISFTEDPKIAYAGGYNEHGRKAVYKINLQTDKILEPVFSDERIDFDHIVRHPNTQNPVGVQYTIDKPSIMYFDKKLKKIQKTVNSALPDTVNEVVSIQLEKKMYLISAKSDIEPGVFYLLDMKIKNLDFISETMPGIMPEDMAVVKPVSFSARDDAKIPGYLTIPKGKQAKNLPTVVLVHGGPQARDEQMFDYTVQFLANRGYAVFQPNFRGSTGYGYQYRNAGNHQWGGVMQDDVTDGAKWLIESGVADPKRLCIAGSSYGGYAAVMGLIKTPDLFKCAISTSAVFNVPAMIAFDRQFIGGRRLTKSMGLEDKDPKLVSPFHRVEEINSPLLIIHSEDDHIVRYRQGERMAEEMNDLNKDVTFVTMKDGDHHLDTEASRTIKLEAMAKFLEANIGQ